MRVNTVTVSGVETVVGGADDDTVVFGAAVTGASVALGDGADTLVLADAGATVFLVPERMIAVIRPVAREP